MSKNIFRIIDFVFTVLTMISFSFFLFIREENRKDSLLIILYVVLVVCFIYSIKVFITERNKYSENISNEYLKKVFKYSKERKKEEIIFTLIEITIFIVSSFTLEMGYLLIPFIISLFTNFCCKMIDAYELHK